MKEETRFKIRFVTLTLATLVGLGSLCLAAWRIARIEVDAQAWVGDLADRIAEAQASAERQHAQQQYETLASIAAEAQKDGGDDLGVRLDNLRFLHRLVSQRVEAAEMVRQGGAWSPVTWWVNPLTGQKTALNATSDGRIDPAAVARIKQGLDLDVAVALAREREAQQAPPSPRERVQRDLAALEGGR